MGVSLDVDGDEALPQSAVEKTTPARNPCGQLVGVAGRAENRFTLFNAML
jgi:hypothetical protein